MTPNQNTAPMYRKIDKILHILEDHHVHSLTEIAERVHLSAEQVALLFRFLATYSFIIYNEQKETAVLCTELLALK